MQRPEHPEPMNVAFVQPQRAQAYPFGAGRADIWRLRCPLISAD